MRYIFLDIDGVLNNTRNTIETFETLGRKKAYEIIHKDLDIWDDVSLRLICKIINLYLNEITVVISSTWRLNTRGIEKIVEKLSIYCDLEQVKIDKTGRDADMNRGNEIEEYITRHNLLNEKYVVIDDDTADIIGEKYNGKIDYKKHFVWCDHNNGFKEIEYNKTLKILKDVKGVEFDWFENEINKE